MEVLLFILAIIVFGLLLGYGIIKASESQSKEDVKFCTIDGCKYHGKG